MEDETDDKSEDEKTEDETEDETAKTEDEPEDEPDKTEDKPEGEMEDETKDGTEFETELETEDETDEQTGNEDETEDETVDKTATNEGCPAKLGFPFFERKTVTLKNMNESLCSRPTSCNVFVRIFGVVMGQNIRKDVLTVKSTGTRELVDSLPNTTNANEGKAIGDWGSPLFPF